MNRMLATSLDASILIFLGYALIREREGAMAVRTGLWT